MIVELLFAERNHVCCRVRGQRQLRAAGPGRRRSAWTTCGSTI